MTRAATLGSMLLPILMLVSDPAGLAAQTKDDTIVYAIQSDVQTWDPPNSVLRESIILGYNVFDHLAARDLKTGQANVGIRTKKRYVGETGPFVNLVRDSKADPMFEFSWATTRSSTPTPSSTMCGSAGSPIATTATRSWTT